MTKRLYYSAMLCTARTMLSQDVRPSVCLSVPPSHAGIPLKQLSHTILFNNKRYGKIPTETPNGGVECRWDMKKSRFSANILPYLGNDTR